DVQQKGVKILLDPKYKGKIAGEDYWLRRMLHASLQAGQDPNNIKDIKAVWDKVRESKRAVFKYWKSGAELMSLLASGEALITDAWGVRVYNLRKQGHPIEPFVPQGAIITIGCFMPLKGSPMDPFYQMVDFLLEPDVQIAMAIEGGQPPLVDPKRFKVPDEVLAIPAYDPTGTLAKYTPIDAYYWNKHEAEWQNEYTRVLARG
ncbi:MAG: extracellular solute-binding protein, partial [Alphaproteobacteria bacterium]|nr:extracellular solute-binding protein [Alphaproteobacteria bacterium]